MVLKEMKSIMEESFKYDIESFSQYRGHGGAELIKFTFKDLSEIVAFRDFARSQGVKVYVKPHKEVYCVFEEDDGLFKLK